MISRSWHGAVPSHFTESFSKHFETNVLPQIAECAGNLGVFVKRQSYGGYEHFFLISYWDNWSSICAFAGDNPQVAIHYPDDDRFSLVADPIVLHHNCDSIDPWYDQK